MNPSSNSSAARRSSGRISATGLPLWESWSARDFAEFLGSVLQRCHYMRQKPSINNELNVFLSLDHVKTICGSSRGD
ncbi:hypothetical protein ACFWRV_20445 [Streptomyces sp. NPDC058576]|uniref:hypothetical protein n=1 Tax=Streptomyces sp. NPDC058576 TaxID=3346547 RepID=UPI00365B0D28